MSDISSTPQKLIINPDKFVSLDSSDKLKKALFKMLEGKDLSEDEKSFLNNTFGDSIDIMKLAKYLKLQGSETNTDRALNEFDKETFKRTSSSEDLSFKQKNFRKELEAFQSRLKVVMTNAPSSINDKIQNLINAIPNDESEAYNPDTFVADLDKEIRDRAKPKDQQTNFDNRFDSLMNDELYLLARGTKHFTTFADKDILLSDKPEVASSSTKDYQELNELPEESTDADVTNFLKTQEAKLPILDKYKAKHLLDKIKNGEAFVEADKLSIRELLQMKSPHVSQAEVDFYYDKFSDTVKDSAIGKTISAANKANLPTVNESDYALLAEASRILGSNAKYPSENTAIKLLEELYNASNSATSLPSDLNDKKAFLNRYVERIYADAQQKRVNSNPDHYSKKEPQKYFEDFKKQIFFLENYINFGSFGFAQREAIKDDLLRFARGEAASGKLEEIFGEKDKHLLEPLNYIKKGYGDSREMQGMLKAMLELPYTVDGKAFKVLDINELAQKSKSFEELAFRLRNAISASKIGEGDMKVPEELLASLEEVSINRLGSLNSLRSGFNTDEKGVKTPNHVYPIFSQLGFYPENVEFKLADSVSILDQINNESKVLGKLLDEIKKLYPDGDFEKLLKAGFDDEDKTAGKGSLKNNGESLANLLLKSITVLEQNYASYDHSKTDNKMSFSELDGIRNEIIKISKDKGLDFYVEDQMMDFMSVSKYEEMLKNFSMNLKPLTDMMRSNKAFYQVPKELEFDLSQYSTPVNTGSPSSGAVVLSKKPSRSDSVSNIDFAWVNDSIKSLEEASGGGSQEDSDEDQNDYSSLAFTDPFKKSMLDKNGKFNFDFSNVYGNNFSETA
jgi:hypothetical protein